MQAKGKWFYDGATLATAVVEEARAGTMH